LQLKEHIVRHLKWDSSLKGAKINVDLVGRTAVLTGTVPNLVAHAEAQKDVQSIPGVELVDNRLTVQFNHNHPNKADNELQVDIEKMLGCAADIDIRRIKVAVQDGIVTLKGAIDALWKKARIEDMASSVDGVLDLRSEITVLPVDRAPDVMIKKDIISAL
jgi:osmotically-inducible protein OsmY